MSLPDPLAGEAAVALDIDARTATVVPAGTDLVAMLWRRGYQAMAQDPYAGPAVWADGVRGEPVAGGLRFTFGKGHPAWPKLVGAAASSAIVTVDRRISAILGVRFRSGTAV